MKEMMESSPLRSVIVVEDEAVIAMDLRRQLEAQGYRVACVVGKAEAVMPAVQLHRPTVVLMDIRLKGDVDGVVLAEEIFVCEDIPVVLLSAFGDPGIYQRAGLVGAYGYLTKPVTQASLVATLEMAVRKHADLRARRQDALWLGGAFDALDTAIIGLDEDGLVRFMNDAAVQLTGWMLMEAKGTSPPWAVQLASLDVAQARSGVAVALTVRAEARPVRVKRFPMAAGGCLCVITSE